MCPPSWAVNIMKISFTSEQIQRKVAEIGANINRVYRDQEIVAVGLLSGAVCFMTDLLRHIKVPYVVSSNLLNYLSMT